MSFFEQKNSQYDSAQHLTNCDRGINTLPDDKILDLSKLKQVTF